MIHTWDWRFRIFFDPAVREEVLRHMDSLTGKEAEQYQAVYDFYTNHYSISMLLQYPQYVDIAEKNVDKLIWTPECVETAPADFRIQELLTYSRNYGNDVLPAYWDLMRTIYQSRFPVMVDAFMHADSLTPLPHGERVDLSRAPEILEKLYNDKSLQERFGCFKQEHYDMEITRGAGFAEWWDRDISPIGKDLLILHENEDLCRENDLLYTLIHEVYPGHAHFYRSTRGHLKDHGNIPLIEGWATFVEWNALPSLYTISTRAAALQSLRDAYTLPVRELPSAIIKRKKLQGYSELEVKRAIQYATQYIGFTDAYYLGALYFESVAGDRNLWEHNII